MRTRDRNGMTTIELTVTLVVIAVLGAISYAPMRALLGTSADSRVGLTVSSVLHAADVYRQHRESPVFAGSDVTDASDASTTAAEYLAASTGFTVVAESTGPTELSWSISDDFTLLTIAAMSPSGRCVVGRAYPNNVIEPVVLPDSPCRGTPPPGVQAAESSFMNDELAPEPTDEPTQETPQEPSNEPLLTVSLASTVQNQTTSGIVEASGDVPAGTVAMLSASPAGPYTTSVSTSGGTFTVVDGDTAAVTFEPAPGYTGDLRVWLTGQTPDGGTLTATEVLVLVTCDAYASQPIGNSCAESSNLGIHAESLTVANRTRIYGDTSVVGRLLVANNTETSVAEVDATGAGVGNGDITAGSFVVESGSNVAVGGNLDVSGGDLLNSSPQTTVHGDVRVAAPGQVVATKTLTVGGTLTAPGGTSGDITAVDVSSAAVAIPGAPALPVLDASAVTVDQTFATFADFAAWWASAGDQIAADGAVVRVTDPSGGTLPSSGTLAGDLTVIVDGPVKINAWPAVDGYRRLGVITTDTSSSALTINGPGEMDASLTAHLHAAGDATIAQRTLLYGSLSARHIDVANQLTLAARGRGGSFGQLLWQP